MVTDNDYLVKPTKVTLGSRDVQRFSGLKRTHGSVLEADTYQLIFLDKLLGKLMENATLQSSLKTVTASPITGLIKEFRDGSFYRNHQFFRKFPNGLILHFFYTCL